MYDIKTIICWYLCYARQISNGLYTYKKTMFLEHKGYIIFHILSHLKVERFMGYGKRNRVKMQMLIQFFHTVGKILTIAIFHLVILVSSFLDAWSRITSQKFRRRHLQATSDFEECKQYFQIISQHIFQTCQKCISNKNDDMI